MLEDAYEKGRSAKDQVKEDVATGRDRAESQAQQARSSVEGSQATTERSYATPASETRRLT